MREFKVNAFSSKLINILIAIPYVSAQQYCYTTGGVFGIIVLSVFITIFAIALTLVLIWFLWNKNLLKLDFILKALKLSKSEANTKKDAEFGRKTDYAFDNPYFEDEEEDHRYKKGKNQTQKDIIILVEGKEANNGSAFKDNNNKYISKSNSDEKRKNGQIVNNRFLQSLPLSTVFNNIQNMNKKPKQESQKSMDDYFFNEKPQRLEVELIGRDFTGLGFNICGNMRDGIFVKDVLNRGPANESGKVRTGDRILGVWVCFESMVFEDAVALLSYASPYNVRIGLENCPQYSTVERTNYLNTNKNLKSFTNKSLLHPLYRSHSFDDLKQIAKDMSMSEKSSSSLGRNVIQRIKTQILNKINAKPVIDENHSNCVANNEMKSEKYNKIDSDLCDVITEDPKIETICSKANQLSSFEDTNQTEDVVDNNGSNLEIKSNSLKDENEVIKKVIPAKRKGKAPQPPCDSIPQNVSLESISLTVETIETKAQVHSQEVPVLLRDQMETFNEDKDVNFEGLDVQTTSSVESIISEEQQFTGKVVSDSVPMRSNSPQRTQTPNGKLKSSSMSDLTNSCHKLQSVLLERAVSLDMNGQSLPEENLSHLHGKNTLVLNDDTTDSMPIINWSLNRQMKNDINSSESTLEETNQSITNKSIKSIEIQSIDSLHDINKEVELVLDESHLSSIALTPITSTPLKDNEKSANIFIDPIIHLDSTMSSNESQSSEQTLVESKEINSEIDFQQNICKISVDRNERPIDEEVIELSATELDGVMMSHKEFLQKQALLKSSHPIPSCRIRIPVSVEPQSQPFESLGFESWSYVSEEEENSSNDNKSQMDSSLYRTALDLSLDEEQNNCDNSKKLPEVSGITLKSEPNGQNGIFISTIDSMDSSFISTSSNSPSK